MVEVSIHVDGSLMDTGLVGITLLGAVFVSLNYDVILFFIMLMPGGVLVSCCQEQARQG